MKMARLRFDSGLPAPAESFGETVLGRPRKASDDPSLGVKPMGLLEG